MNLLGVKTFRCKTCKLDKPEDDFPIERNSRIGHRSDCKKCHALQRNMQRYPNVEHHGLLWFEPFRPYLESLIFSLGLNRASEVLKISPATLCRWRSGKQLRVQKQKAVILLDVLAKVKRGEIEIPQRSERVEKAIRSHAARRIAEEEARKSEQAQKDAWREEKRKYRQRHQEQYELARERDNERARERRREKKQAVTA